MAYKLFHTINRVGYFGLNLPSLGGMVSLSLTLSGLLIMISSLIICLRDWVKASRHLFGRTFGKISSLLKLCSKFVSCFYMGSWREGLKSRTICETNVFCGSLTLLIVWRQIFEWSLNSKAYTYNINVMIHMVCILYIISAYLDQIGKTP